MKFFMDTANLDEIRSGVESGLLDGVTTNPSLIAKQGKRHEDQLLAICEMVKGPVSAEVLVASVRHPRHVLDAARMGAHVCTLPAKLFEQLVRHPLTDVGLEKFLSDAKKTPR